MRILAKFFLWYVWNLPKENNSCLQQNQRILCRRQFEWNLEEKPWIHYVIDKNDLKFCEVLIKRHLVLSQEAIQGTCWFTWLLEWAIVFETFKTVKALLYCILKNLLYDDFNLCLFFNYLDTNKHARYSNLFAALIVFCTLVLSIKQWMGKEEFHDRKTRSKFIPLR